MCVLFFIIGTKVQPEALRRLRLNFSARDKLY